MAHTYRLELGCLVVGITGSIGKTTTKDVLAAVLAKRYRVWATKGNFNNLIGMPLTVLSAPADTEVPVLEMGMNHFGELSRMTAAAPVRQSQPCHREQDWYLSHRHFGQPREHRPR